MSSVGNRNSQVYFISHTSFGVLSRGLAEHLRKAWQCSEKPAWIREEVKDRWTCCGHHTMPTRGMRATPNGHSSIRLSGMGALALHPP